MPSQSEGLLAGFQLGYGVGEKYQEKKKKSTISDAFATLGELGTTPQPTQPAAIPVPAVQPQQAGVEGIPTAAPTVADAVVADDAPPLKIQDHTDIYNRGLRALSSAGASPEVQAQYRQQYSETLDTLGKQKLNAAVNAMQAGDLEAAARYATQFYGYQPDGSSAVVKATPNGLAMTFTDDVTGKATTGPMLISDPRDLLVKGTSMMDAARGLEIEDRIQVMDVRKQKAKNANDIFEATKDLKIEGLELSNLQIVKNIENNTVQQLVWNEKINKSARGKGIKPADWLKQEKEISKNVDTLYTAGDTDITGLDALDIKATAAAFAQNNLGRPASIMAKVGVDYSRLQDEAMATAQATVSEDPNFGEMSKDSTAYRRAVRKEMINIMQTDGSHKVVDDKSYFVSDSGDAFLVPARFISGNPDITTSFDRAVNIRSQIDSDPVVKKARAVAGIKSGKIPMTSAPASTTSPAASEGQVKPAGTPTEGVVTSEAPKISAVDIAAEAKKQQPEVTAAPAAIPTGPAAAPTPKKAKPVSGDPLEQGMIPETSGGYGKYSASEAKSLNDSLRKVRMYAVSEGKDKTFGKPTVRDLKLALEHPGNTPSQKKALEVLISKSVVRGPRHRRTVR